MSHFNPRRLPSPSDSQDSFACDLDNKPEEQYLARSDKFAVPLSELGKHASPIHAPSNLTASLSYHKGRSPPSGRILVEATPSHSGSSQHDEPLTLSHELEATQLVDDRGGVFQKDIRSTDKDGNGSGYESSEPSSSYRRFLDGERGSEHQMQATQPSSQVDDSNAPPISEDAIPWSNLRSAPHPSTSSAPQSLLSMVAPENRWRYRQYMQSGSGAYENRGIMPSTFGQTSNSRDGRTPSTFPVSSMGRSFPSGPTITRDLRPRIRSSPVRPDAMDVVPDSEPIAHEEMLQTSKQTAVLAVPQTSANPVHLSKEPMTEDSDMDLDLPERDVAHQREEEEEEEEIPLASLAAKQVKNTTAGARGNVVTDMPPPSKMPAKVRHDFSPLFHLLDDFRARLWLQPKQRKLCQIQLNRKVVQGLGKPLSSLPRYRNKITLLLTFATSSPISLYHRRVMLEKQPLPAHKHDDQDRQLPRLGL
jgi:hypothetical protein